MRCPIGRKNYIDHSLLPDLGASIAGRKTHQSITLLTEDVAEAGQLWISVTNLEPGGGTAGPQAFDIA